MKVFSVEDEYVPIVESILDTISRKEPDVDIDSFVFGMVYKDTKYSIGYWMASPADMSMISGYIQMEASARNYALNKKEYDDMYDCEGESI